MLRHGYERSIFAQRDRLGCFRQHHLLQPSKIEKRKNAQQALHAMHGLVLLIFIPFVVFYSDLLKGEKKKLFQN